MALLPNDSYQVYCKKNINADEWASLTSLYQPIIGSFATNLYQTLLLQAQYESDDAFLHLDLCNTLDLGISHLESVREKLEGIGLLKVYRKEEEFQTVQYFYEIILPMLANQFLKDEVLSFLLLEKIGELNYQRLVTRFTKHTLLTAGFKEVTKSFKEVYTFDQQKLSHTIGELQKNKDKLDSQAKIQNFEQLALNDVTINWQFLFDLAAKKFIQRKNINEEICRKLALFHSLYGYDELALVDILAQSVNFSTGEIDEKVLEHEALVREQVSNTATILPETDDNQLRKERFLKQGFTQADWELILQCEEYYPIEYLREIKQFKNSFSSKQEEWLVRELVERSPLSNAVINFLINYLLIVQNRTNLPAQLTSTIAADWSEKKILLPEQAMIHVRKIVDESKEKQRNQQTNRKGQNYRNVRTEQVPEWMKNPPEEVKNPESTAAAKKALDALLNKEGEQ